MRYARPGWRKIWLDGGGDKDPLRLRRFPTLLQDWDYGHVWQFGNYYPPAMFPAQLLHMIGVTYHGTANFGFTPLNILDYRFISDKTP